ncbi:MAG: PDGLE domain-containing protein [Spirochaetota bacterium]
MKKIRWPVFLSISLLVAFFLAIFISPFASSFPDGLEKVAEDKGFVEKEKSESAWKFSLIPDYNIPGIQNEVVTRALAGLIGTMIVFVITFGISKIISKPGRRKDN